MYKYWLKKTTNKKDKTHNKIANTKHNSQNLILNITQKKL